MSGNKRSSHVLGKKGEQIALDFVRKRKYKIVGKNFRFQRGEIDIIAYDGQTLVFLEVKTRKSRKYGPPEESVTPAKQVQIRKVAQWYLVKKGLTDVACRFDVLAITMEEDGNNQIHHIQNAF
jgi:putative endonuclease